MSEGKILKSMQYIISALRPDAEDLSHNTGRSLPSVLSTMLKPLIKATLEDSPDLSEITSLDGRAREWLVKLEFWDMSAGEDQAEMLSENDGDITLGFNGVVDLIREYARSTHQPTIDNAADSSPHLTIEALQKKLKNIRPAISRTGGHAMLRIPYTLGRNEAYLCRAKITRYVKG